MLPLSRFALHLGCILAGQGMALAHKQALDAGTTPPCVANVFAVFNAHARDVEQAFLKVTGSSSAMGFTAFSQLVDQIFPASTHQELRGLISGIHRASAGPSQTKIPTLLVSRAFKAAQGAGGTELYANSKAVVVLGHQFPHSVQTRGRHLGPA